MLQKTEAGGELKEEFDELFLAEARDGSSFVSFKSRFPRFS